jgi:hypothetical protein
MGREAAPTAVVLQFVEPVLAVGAITVKLPDRQDFRVQRGRQGGIFPQLLVHLAGSLNPFWSTHAVRGFPFMVHRNGFAMVALK